jgi:hypothetical protein
MNQWQEHTENTWIVEDNAQRVIALVRYHRRSGVYEARKLHKKIGYYTTLQAAQQATQPPTKIKPQHTQFNTKTIETMPWDS